MKILDTNLWVFGTLGTNDEAVGLLDRIETGVYSRTRGTTMPIDIDTFEQTPEDELR